MVEKARRNSLFLAERGPVKAVAGQVLVDMAAHVVLCPCSAGGRRSRAAAVSGLNPRHAPRDAPGAPPAPSTPCPLLALTLDPNAAPLARAVLDIVRHGANQLGVAAVDANHGRRRPVTVLLRETHPNEGHTRQRPSTEKRTVAPCRRPDSTYLLPQALDVVGKARAGRRRAGRVAHLRLLEPAARLVAAAVVDVENVLAAIRVALGQAAGNLVVPLAAVSALHGERKREMRSRGGGQMSMKTVLPEPQTSCCNPWLTYVNIVARFLHEDSITINLLALCKTGVGI